MVKRCFIANCSSKEYQENISISFFRPPKDYFQQWQDKIPKSGLKPTSTLCSLHFDDDDIVKGKMIGDTFHAQQLWRLKKGTLPKHLLGTPIIMNQRQPLQCLTTNKDYSAKKKTFKGRCKPIKSIIGSASLSSSVSNMLPPMLLQVDESLTGLNDIQAEHFAENVNVIDNLTQREIDLSTEVNDVTLLTSVSSSDQVENNVDMDDSSIEIDNLVAMAGSESRPSLTFREDTQVVNHVPISTDARNGSLLNASFTETRVPDNEDTEDTSVETVESGSGSSIEFCNEDVSLSTLIPFQKENNDEASLTVSSTTPGYNEVKMIESIPSSSFADVHDKLDGAEESATFRGIDLSFFEQIKSKVKLPSHSWNWIYNSDSNLAICVTCLCSPHGSINIKSLAILSTNRASFCMDGRDISMPNSSGFFENFDQLSDLLASFDCKKPCKGICNPEFDNLNFARKGSVLKHGDIWRSKGCSYIASPNCYNEQRTRGGLLFVTVELFKTICEVEKVVASHFKSTSHIFVDQTFQECIAKISLIGVLPIFCDSHRDNNMPDLIMEYVKVRYYFESKRLKNLLLSKEKANVQSNFKLAKTAHSKDVANPN